MLLGRALSRDIARLQLRQLQKVLDFTTNASKSQQLAFRVAFVARTKLHRNYATAATKPTRTVRAAVKRSARQPVRKTTRATTAAKAKKPATRKAAPKKKVKAAKKKVVKRKAAPKKPTKPKKKIPTERQKHLAERARLRDLRATALDPPRGNTTSAWQLYVAESLKNKVGKLDGAIMKDTATKFKTLSPAEREHFNHLANESTAANNAAYSAWLKKHTPLEIRRANNARSLLAKLRRTRPELKGSIPAKNLRAIQDDRRVARPRNPIVIFSTERRHTGDFKNISIPESSKLIAEEWKALTESEKKKYIDLSSKDKDRYHTEHLKVYGIPVGSKEATVSL